MKKILILCILLTVSSRAQQVTTIVPIGEPFFESGTYLKDIDNTFLPFIGTWEGIINNKKYTIKLIKFPQHLHNTGTGKYYFRDLIKGGLKVQDLTTNIILYDNLLSTIYDDLQIIGLSSPYDRNFRFIFRDTDENCNNSMQFTLQTIVGNPNQLKYLDFKFTDGRSTFDCPQYQTREQIPRTIPDGSFMLTKI
jgi:hypothetical protein